MGLRSSFYRLLSRGSDASDKSSEYVELGVLTHVEGPVVLAQLLEHGIDAQAHETFDVAIGRPGGLRILVPRHSFEEAVRLWGGSASR